MNKHHQLNYIEFTSSDLAAAEKFYSDAFGWKFTSFGDAYTAFNDGDMDGGFTTDSPTDGRPLAILYSENLEESQKLVEEHGAQVTVPIFSFPGGRRFQFRDPSGNELAIWSDK